MISDSERSHSIIFGQNIERYEYINEVYPNGSHRYEGWINSKHYIYCIDNNSSPDSLPNLNCVLGCCGNFIKITIPEE